MRTEGGSTLVSGMVNLDFSRLEKVLDGVLAQLVSV